MSPLHMCTSVCLSQTVEAEVRKAACTSRPGSDRGHVPARQSPAARSQQGCENSPATFFPPAPLHALPFSLFFMREESVLALFSPRMTESGLENRRQDQGTNPCALRSNASHILPYWLPAESATALQAEKTATRPPLGGHSFGAVMFWGKPERT